MENINYNEKFKNDLKWGELGEKVIAKWLETYKGFSGTIFNPNKNSDFDFSSSIKGKTVLFELKTDRWEYFKNKITNNIFIEVSCSDKLSGVHTTKSDIFVYFFPDLEEAYFIKTEDLKELIKTPGLKLTEQSGDKGKVKGILINRNIFKEHFNIENITKLKIWD
jgi:hypothetical protein